MNRSGHTYAGGKRMYSLDEVKKTDPEIAQAIVDEQVTKDIAAFIATEPTH